MLGASRIHLAGAARGVRISLLPNSQARRTQDGEEGTSTFLSVSISGLLTGGLCDKRGEGVRWMVVCSRRRGGGNRASTRRTSAPRLRLLQVCVCYKSASVRRPRLLGVWVCSMFASNVRISDCSMSASAPED
jgi:hypothetical protein